jgi:hypothetical protein
MEEEKTEGRTCQTIDLIHDRVVFLSAEIHCPYPHRAAAVSGHVATDRPSSFVLSLVLPDYGEAPNMGFRKHSHLPVTPSDGAPSSTWSIAMPQSTRLDMPRSRSLPLFITEMVMLSREVEKRQGCRLDAEGANRPVSRAALVFLLSLRTTAASGNFDIDKSTLRCPLVSSMSLNLREPGMHCHKPAENKKETPSPELRRRCSSVVQHLRIL